MGNLKLSHYNEIEVFCREKRMFTILDPEKTMFAIRVLL